MATDRPLVLALVLAITMVACAPHARTSTPAEHAPPALGPCPLVERGETAADCPWAALARLLTARADGGQPIDEELARLAPGITGQLDADATRTAWLGLWGRSVNFDELAKGVIVHPAILDAILARGAGPRRVGRIAHAGLEHSYGYLFSTLRTPFGYKRARWVSGEIERGLALPPTTFGAAPEQGTLWSNLTYFLGRLALGDDAGATEVLALEREGVAQALLDYPYADLGGVRLEETVQLAEQRTVVLRTDLVPFSDGAGGALLVYSVYDSQLAGARLISAFPVDKAFVERATAASRLGDAQPITTQYNAFVAGLSDAAAPLVGSRRLTRR